MSLVVFPRPGGAKECSPGRQPWEATSESEPLAPEGRKNLRMLAIYRPSGAFDLRVVRDFPRLAPWANFSRPSGAEGKGSVKIPVKGENFIPDKVYC